MTFAPLIVRLENDLAVIRLAQHNRSCAKHDLYLKIAELDDREAQDAELLDAIERTLFILTMRGW